MSSCASCSISLKPGARFCHGCGKPALSKAAATPPRFGGSSPSIAAASPPSSPAAPATGLAAARFGAAKPATTPAATVPKPAATTTTALTWSQRQALQRQASTDSAEKSAAEKSAAENAAAERLAAEKAALEKAAAERAAVEKAAAEKAAAELAASERVAAEKAAAEKAAAEKAAAEKAAAAAPTPAPASTPALLARPTAGRGGFGSSSSPSRPGFIPSASSPTITRGASRPGPSGSPGRGGLQVPGGPSKRHSKIDMDVSEIQGSLAGLDVEGIQVKHERPGVSVTREAPASTISSVSSPSLAVASPPASPASSAPAAGGGRGGGLANRFQQMMAEKAEAERQAERQKIRGRRKGATEFVDKQIRMLISILQNHGGSITYAELFRQTADSMPALSATLAVAQKRGVMGYEGTMLMQGVHDSVKITLLRDEIEDSSVFVSVYGIAPVKEDEGPKKENCHICSKQVYPTERIAASGKTMHKACFRCCTCNGVLKLSQFAFNGGKFYCDTHFKELFSRGGGGYNF